MRGHCRPFGVGFVFSGAQNAPCENFSHVFLSFTAAPYVISELIKSEQLLEFMNNKLNTVVFQIKSAGDWKCF